MNGLLSVGGVAIAGLVLFDVVTTTLAVGSGGGPLVSRWTLFVWRVSRRFIAEGRHSVLRGVGLMVVLSVPVGWLLLIWAAWALVFSGAQGAVLETDTGAPAGLVDRIYFAGYSVLTLGNGEFRPAEGIWQLATVAASANGLVLVTLGVTYLIPVTQAASRRRELAAYLSSLGETPQELLRSTWDGQGFGPLCAQASRLALRVLELEQAQLTYPVLDYFHSERRRHAVAPSLAVLDEAITVVLHGIPPAVRPQTGVLEPVRDAVEGLLYTLRAGALEPSPEAPPAPLLDDLAAAGIPTTSPATYRAGLEALQHRRQLLRGFVEHDGWTWDAVTGDGRERVA